MTREPRSEPPDADGLAEGLRGAMSLCINETDIQHAVGETGVLRGSVEVFLDRGRARHTKASVSFEKRFEVRRG